MRRRYPHLKPQWVIRVHTPCRSFYLTHFGMWNRKARAGMHRRREMALRFPTRRTALWTIWTLRKSDHVYRYQLIRLNRRVEIK